MKIRKIETVLAISAGALLLVILQTAPLAAQEQPKNQKSAEAKAAEAKPTPEAAPKEESSVTEHTIKIGGQTIPYKANASTTFLKDEKGDPTASIFSIAYTRSDVKDLSARPIAFIYNGGPGSASLWLHMGAFGPRRVATADAAQTPPPPYKLVDNADCLLDKADLVFIDPVGTGFSHALGKAQNKDFWGIDQDVKSLAEFISTFVSRNNRWNSPKFLIGESYGTFRSAALGNYLQSQDGMYINGIVLISTVLDINTLSFSTGNDMTYLFYLPSYAAAAWYYKTLKDRPDDLAGFLNDARRFASTEYAEALMKGSSITDSEKSDIAKKLAHFTGLSEEFLIKADLRVTLAQFNAELERSRGLTIGRYDARYSGPTYDLLTERSEYDPSYTAVSGAFTAAFNTYCREELKYSPDRTYENAESRAEPQLGLEAQYRPHLRALRSQCRRRSRASLAHKLTPAGSGRKWPVRSGDSFLRHGVHHGPPRPARQSPQPHPSRILRIGPHDLPARRRSLEAEGQCRRLH